MNKSIIILVVFMFAGLSAIGQTVSTEAADSKSKKCVPTEACAKKMGMTLEECKKVCNKKSATGEADVASSSAYAVTASTEKKACTKTSAKCASKSGAKTASCQKLDTASTTDVAAASAEAVVESQSGEKKVCSKKTSCNKK